MSSLFSMYPSALPRFTGAARPVSAAAFSLVELIVVIAIIAILVGAITLGIGRTSSPSVQAAANAIYAQLQATRTVAAMNNAPSRLLIEKEPESVANSQRTIVVTSTNVGQWTPASPFSSMPKGTYVLLEGDLPRSTKGGANNQNAEPETMTFNGREFAFYEFSPTGSCEANAAARIVIGVGHHSGPGWVQQNKSHIHGLFLSRLGEPVFFEDPDHIKGASP